MLGVAADALDYPGRKIRGWLGGTDGMSGRELLEQYGIVGPNTDQGWVPDMGDLAGYAVDVATDPISYIPFGALAGAMGLKSARMGAKTAALASSATPPPTAISQLRPMAEELRRIGPALLPAPEPDWYWRIHRAAEQLPKRPFNPHELEKRLKSAKEGIAGGEYYGFRMPELVEQATTNLNRDDVLRWIERVGHNPLSIEARQSGPTNLPSIFRSIADQIYGTDISDWHRREQYTLPGGSDYSMAVAKWLPNKFENYGIDDVYNMLRSQARSHYDMPGDFLRLRAKMRDVPGLGRIPVMEEMQSDLLQAYAKPHHRLGSVFDAINYRPPSTAMKAADALNKSMPVSSVRKNIQPLIDDMSHFIKRISNARMENARAINANIRNPNELEQALHAIASIESRYQQVVDSLADGVAQNRWSPELPLASWAVGELALEMKGIDPQRYAKHIRALDNIYDAITGAYDAAYTMPYRHNAVIARETVPFLDDWERLGMKMLAKAAAKEGHPAFGWQPGRTMAYWATGAGGRERPKLIAGLQKHSDETLVNIMNKLGRQYGGGQVTRGGLGETALDLASLTPDRAPTDALTLPFFMEQPASLMKRFPLENDARYPFFQFNISPEARKKLVRSLPYMSLLPVAGLGDYLYNENQGA